MARPSVSLKVLSSKLDKVRHSRVLKVRVSAQTESNGVAITSKKGTRTLTKPVSGIDLAAGASQAVKLHLTKAGRNAPAGLQKATVKATATVPFGSAASAKRTLR